MTGILIALLYSALFIYVMRKHSFFREEGISSNAFILAFSIKIIFGFIFWFIFTHHVPYQQRGDAFLYFEDGKAIYRALFERPLDYVKILLGSDDPSLTHYLDNTGYWHLVYNQGLYNETRTVIRFNAIVDIFSLGHYHVHTVFMCFLSLIGLTGIYKTFAPYLADKKKELFIMVFFLPSVLFWGSGVLKEGLTLFASGMLIYHWHKLVSQKISFLRIMYVILFAWLLTITKIYMLLFLLPALAAHAWILKTNGKRPALKYGIVFTLYIVAALIQPKVDIPFKLMDKQRQTIYMASGGTHLGIVEENKFIYISPKIKHRIDTIPGKPGYCKIAEGVPYVSWYYDNFTDSTYVQHSTDTATYWIYYDLKEAGSHIDIPLLYPSYSSIVKNAPNAFFTTAFRPHFGDAKNPLMLMSAIENLLIGAFILVCIFFAARRVPHYHLVFFCLSVAVGLFVLIGLTTPVLGSVVRYKVPAMPLLLIAFLLILDKEKLLRKFPVLRKILG